MGRRLASRTGLLLLAAAGCQDPGVLDPDAWEATPAAVDFGQVFVGGTARARVRLKNLGTLPLHVQAFVATPFEAQPGDFVLAWDSATEVAVAFRPGAVRAYGGVLTLESKAGRIGVPLNGTGRAPPPCPSDPCHLVEFDPDTGACRETPRPDGTPCSIPCIEGTCADGACRGTPGVLPRTWSYSPAPGWIPGWYWKRGHQAADGRGSVFWAEMHRREPNAAWIDAEVVFADRFGAIRRTPLPITPSLWPVTVRVVGEDVLVAEPERIMAFDAASGVPRWARSASQLFPEAIDPWIGSLTEADGRLILSGWDGEFGTEGAWGFTSLHPGDLSFSTRRQFSELHLPPFADEKGRVFATLWEDSDDSLASYSSRGEPLWEVPTPSAHLVAVANGRLFLQRHATGSLDVRSTEDGGLLAQFDFPTDPVPVVLPEAVFTAAVPCPTCPPEVRASDPETGRLLWSREVPAKPYFLLGTEDGGVLVVSGAGGIRPYMYTGAYAFDHAGRTKLACRLPTGAAGDSPALLDGLLLVWGAQLWAFAVPLAPATSGWVEERGSPGQTNRPR